MLESLLSRYRIILASQSPRRRQLLQGLDIPFEVEVREIEETYPEELKEAEIAVYLSEMKASAFNDSIDDKTLVITADTIVWIDGTALTKPHDYDDAVRILKKLSGRMHEVITGVCFKTSTKMHSFHAMTKVYFKHLNDEEIDYYISRYKPYDKAGSYGAQEWIGYVAIERIEGSYFNVMGLPTRMLYEELEKFVR
jgi:septum formation protein